jgi:cbb3-type cytochrome oxidase maturation protein
MSFLWITIPVSLLVTGTLLALVLRALGRGDFDDWEGPAARHALDDDRAPEHDATNTVP